MSLLVCTGLSKRYGGLAAVSDVDLTINAGEIRALIGPNGAGKTTLVGMISGRIEASSGQVHFDGRNVSRVPAHGRIRRGMAYTFQITSVFAQLPVRENVALAVRGDLKAADAALDRVGLLPLAGDLAGDLAYGHQRLLEIAMGLSQQPKLLILDEPTQGLTDAEITDFNALVRSLVPQTTILLIEHNMSVVMAVADQITVLDFGSVLAEGAPAEIRANAAVQAAYLGTAA
jgi:branched-chain amino acid transport system ATP-binding protein